MLFFSDMDGTFLTDEKRITPESWAALDAIAAAGGQFVPCSGRAYTGLHRELLAHPAVRYAVCANGAAVCDAATGEAVHRECLGPERALAMYEATRGRDVTFDVFADGACYTMRRDYDRLDQFVDDPHILATMRGTRTPVDVEIPQVVEEVRALERIAVYWRDPADLAALWPLARALPHVSVVRSYPMNIEVSDERGTKGAGLVWLCGFLGVPVSESVGFGDQLNDLSMVESAGTGCAVANAEPEVRAAADVIVASNNENGVARYIMERLAG